MSSELPSEHRPQPEDKYDHERACSDMRYNKGVFHPRRKRLQQQAQYALHECQAAMVVVQETDKDFFKKRRSEIVTVRHARNLWSRIGKLKLADAQRNAARWNRLLSDMLHLDDRHLEHNPDFPYQEERQHKPPPPPPPPFVDQQPIDDAQYAELLRKLDWALDQLPRHWHTTIRLFYWSGLSREEIAKVFDRRSEDIRDWLHRARARLRELLGGDDDGTADSDQH